MATFIKTKEGNWQAQVYLGRDAAGKKLRLVETYGTRAEAEAWATDEEGKRNRGTLVRLSKTTLSAWVHAYLDRYAAEDVRTRTLHGYKALVRRWVDLDQRVKGTRSKKASRKHLKGCPNIGCIEIGKLTVDNVQGLYDHMRKKCGLSVRQVRQLHAVIHPALAQAEREGKVGRNVAGLVKLPKQQTEPAEALDGQQIKAFLAAAESDKWNALWVLLIGSGVRPAEALALRWSDIQGGSMTIARALVEKTTVGPRHFAPPKTASGHRTIPVLPQVEAALRQHKVKQNMERLAAGKSYTDEGLIFASATGTPLTYSNLVRRHFGPVMQRAGLVNDAREPLFHVYCLRHSFATQMLFEAEVPVKLVSAWLGHKSVAFTLDVYVKARTEHFEEAAPAAALALFGT